jgi:phosphoribosylformylglycinamidine cyclo-ligase
MATDHLLYFLRASTGFPAADPTRAARRGPLQTQRVDFCQGATMMRRASLSCSSTSSGGEGRLTYKDGGVDIDADAELVRRIARMAPGIGGFGGLFPYSNAGITSSLLTYPRRSFFPLRILLHVPGFAKQKISWVKNVN